MTDDRRYDVAISFGTSDVEIATEIARRLRSRGVSVYVYVHTPEETLGRDLVQTLRRVYGSATLVVALISQAYDTEYTRIELEAARAGEAGPAGIVPVRVDESPLPEALEGVTWWSLGEGTDGLIDTLLRTLRRASMTTPWLLLAALATSAALGAYVLGILGFRKPGRWPDAAFHFALLAPLAWVGIVRVIPHLVQRSRARRLRGAVLLQTPLLRTIEFSSPYLAALAVVVCVIAGSYATVVARDVRTVYATRAAALVSLNSRWTEFHGAVVAADNLAAKAATAFLPVDRARSEDVAAAFESKLDEIKDLEAEMRGSLSNSEELAGEELSTLLESSQTIVRVLERSIGYQVEQLARPPTTGLSTDSDLRGRKLKADMIINYGTLLHETMNEADEAYTALKKAIGEQQSNLSHRWAGVVPPHADPG